MERLIRGKIKMGRKVKSSVKKGFQVFLILGIFFFLGKVLIGTWNELAGTNYVLNFNFLFLLVSYLFLLSALLVTTAGWRIILKSLGEGLGYGKAVRLMCLPALVKFIPGKIAFVFSRIYLCGKEGIGRKKAAVSFVFEMTFALLSGLLVFLISLIFWRNANIEILPIIVLVFLGFIFLCPNLFNGIINFGLRILKREEADFRIPYRKVLLILFVFMINWVLQGTAFFFLAKSLFLIDSSLYFVILGIYPLAWTLGFLTFLTPAGLGVREGILVFLLSFYLPLPAAIIISLVSRLWNILFQVVRTGVALKL